MVPIDTVKLRLSSNSTMAKPVHDSKSYQQKGNSVCGTRAICTFVPTELEAVSSDALATEYVGSAVSAEFVEFITTSPLALQYWQYL